MVKSGRSTTLHFLTREAANEEMQQLERELERVNALLTAKDTIIAQKDSLIQEVEQEGECTVFYS